MRVATKRDYLSMAARGILGNQMPSWPDVESAKAAGHRGTVMIRYKAPNSPFMRADVPLDDADRVMAGLVGEGADRRLMYLTWMSPSVGRRINAEVWRGPGGLYLNYSTAQTHVRAALEGSGKHAEGTAARLILEWACCPNSLDDIEALLELYPDAVIELTAFDREIGDIPGRNTVIWEVRNY